ncbi:ATP-binding protein [Phormidesmis sp. 146-12]
MQLIGDGVGDGLILANPQGEFVLFNQAAERMFGRLTNERSCEEWSQTYGLFLPDQQTHFPDQELPLYQAIRGEYATDVEVFVRRDSDSEGCWISISGFPIWDQNHDITGGVITCRDITDRKEAELERSRLLAEAEAAREEAEEANRSKNGFVAMVAHELRSPLNSIQGWAKLLKNRKLDEAATTKALDTIVRNTEAQVQLVEDLLDMSRMVRGTLQIQMAPVNWGSVIEAALEVVRPIADAKQIQLETHIAATPQISGDSNRLQQIAVNLLTNAIKFTPQQGRVEIDLERVENHAHLCIRDTGKGIAAEFLPFVFEQFQQGQQDTGSKDGLGLGLAIGFICKFLVTECYGSKDGLGLGLAIVKNLVELHQGTISAESPGIGQGATFTVKFPVLKAISLDCTTTSGNLLDLDQTTLTGIRIFVVDDEPDMVGLVTFILEEYGAGVKSALSAAATLEQFSEFKPDILISDIAMPNGNGYELLQQVRSRPDGNIPAIALTAYSSATYEERSLQAGFERHLTKPVEPNTLITAILHLVQAKNTRV